VFANLLTGLGIDERFTRTTGGTTSTFLTDLLGSTLALTDSTGTIQTNYGYQPYGARTATGATNSNTYQFTGRERTSTMFVYDRGRYYYPGSSRFMSEDPIGLGGGLNLYAYANGDPIDETDQLGLCGGNGKPTNPPPAPPTCKSLNNQTAGAATIAAGAAWIPGLGGKIISTGAGMLASEWAREQGNGECTTK